MDTSKVALKVQALALPTEYNNLVSCSFAPIPDRTESITFHPYPNTWHYISVDLVPTNHTKIADCESYLRQDEKDTNNQSLSSLMRDDKGRFFTFEYGLPTTDIQESTSLVNLTSSDVTVLKFSVNQILDIGGTLALEASLLMNIKYYMGYKRPRSHERHLLAFTEDSQYFKVVICADVGHSSTPLANGYCKFNDHVKPALFVLNSTDSDSIYEKTYVPFPDNGDWYLSFRLFCDNIECPCKTSNNGSVYYVGSNQTNTTNATLEDGDSISNIREGANYCNSTVVLSISSSSCVEGRCSNRGNCMLNTFGGLVMSFCACWYGYGGKELITMDFVTER